ncbi:sigma-70 family RNA polymerase sigma factor [Paracraurococcus lichenis]|uniref:RNA polymerase sigma factor n=1 Tax=Paracraurococcus lichenis TaxID=3064888 RepID=A0ABT9EDA6_9PROT|nr:sigma-70 family RNA polymerase sigma factor [Paracraurococcus sp. LOR1-02]MDO9714005.1 sigma-70 family RNA polymerase sigma factor [Paracraurococcus sp. LOR1-02]
MACSGAQPAAAPEDWSGCILAIARAGDRAAFATLFAHFAPRLKAYFRRASALGDAASEELAQDAMLAVWRKAAQFDPARAAAETWIFAIARNLCIDRLRQMRAATALHATLEQWPEVPEAPCSSAAFERAAEQESLRRALQELPEEQLRLLRLAYFAEKSHAAIAAELGMPLGTVKGRLRMALQRLRGVMRGPDKATHDV